MSRSRRNFLQTVGMAGVAGTVAGLNAQGRGAQQASGPAEFPKPDGLKAGGQLDSRCPVSFAAPVSQGLRLVMEYFTALNQRDAAGIAKTLHFPFAIYEEIEPIVVQTAADFVANPPPSLNGTAKGKSKILKGS